MKKLITILLTVIMAVACCFGLAACGPEEPADNSKPYAGINKIETLADIKVGLICLHGNSSTYDKNFIDAFNAATANLGVQKVIKTDIPESSKCYETAVELVNEGCDIIFANSFGHESFILQAAKEYPEVQFCHATGTMAHTATRGNFHNAFASIYEGRYLAGVAAGLKLQEMIAANEISANNMDGTNIKLGYVGAFTYAEVISGYTSWYLGVKSVVPNVVMDVSFTGSWYDETAEKTAAQTLINNGCAIISQHADSMGAPTACQDGTIPNVAYNGLTGQDTCIISSRINWQPYYEYIINCVNKGEEIVYDWSKGLGDNLSDTNASVVVDIGPAAADNTEAYLNGVIAQLKAGTRKVFDINNFTVGGKKLAAYRADVDTDAKYTPDTEVIFADYNGEGAISYFHESATGFRSAPYFDLRIDGIKLLNQKY